MGEGGGASIKEGGGAFIQRDVKYIVKGVRREGAFIRHEEMRCLFESGRHHLRYFSSVFAFCC